MTRSAIESALINICQFFRSLTYPMLYRPQTHKKLTR